MKISPKEKALRQWLAVHDAVRFLTRPTSAEKAKLAAADEAIRALGYTRDALLAEHLESARPLVETWLVRAGVEAVVREHPEGLLVEARTPVDCCSGLWARFQRWLGMQGLRLVRYGTLVERLGVDFQCLLQPGPFAVTPLDAPHVESTIEKSELALGRFVLEHMLPAPRYEPSFSERIQALGRRWREAFGLHGGPSKADWESWSG